MAKRGAHIAQVMHFRVVPSQKYKVHGLDTKDSPIKDVDSTNFPILKGF